MILKGFDRTLGSQDYLLPSLVISTGIPNMAIVIFSDLLYKNNNDSAKLLSSLPPSALEGSSFGLVDLTEPDNKRQWKPGKSGHINWAVSRLLCER